MKIVDIKPTYIALPYPQQVEPAWAPGVKYQRLGVTVVQVSTDEGIEGIAATHSHGGAEFPADQPEYDDLLQLLTIEQQVKPYLIGENPLDIENSIQVVRKASKFGSIPWFIMIALWDIIGKSCNQPLYKLWGGGNSRVRAYASTCELRKPKRRANDALKLKKEGFTALKLRFHHEDLHEDLEVSAAVRDAVGDEFSIMVDANQAHILPSHQKGPIWDYNTALSAAKELEEQNAEWLEEPLYAYDFYNLQRLTRNTKISIAGGESSEGISEFKQYLDRGIYDIIQADPCYSEGIGQLRKIAALAEANFAQFIPHCWSNGLALAANLHLVASLPNCEWLEYPYDPPAFPREVFYRVLCEPIEIDDDGYVTIPDKPGLGVELNEDLLEEQGKTLDDIT